MVLSPEQQEINFKKSKSIQKIGLMGPFGFGNLGDAAIQQAAIQNIHKYCPNAEIYGFSLNPKDTETRHGISSFSITRMGDRKQWWLGKNPSKLTANLVESIDRISSYPNPLIKKMGYVSVALLLEIMAVARAYKNIGNLDMFVVSGGGQLDDYWWGTWCHPYTLFLWSTLAKLRGIKFAIVSVGAGPIDAKLSRIFIKYALSLADYRSYRDEDSKKYIARVVGFKKEASVFPDLAHSLSIEKYQRDCNRTGQQKLLVVGISPMCYFDPRYWMERDRSVYLGYLTKLAEFVAWLIEQEYQIVYFTSCTQEDPPALEDLKAILAQQGITYSPGQIVEQPINTVDELMTEIVKTDIAIASRFHGVLLSLVLHKPTLAISYYRKIDMLMNDTEQAEYCVSIDTFAVEELKQKFISLAANREKIATQLAKHSQNYRATLNKQYESLFNN